MFLGGISVTKVNISIGNSIQIEGALNLTSSRVDFNPLITTIIVDGCANFSGKYLVLVMVFFVVGIIDTFLLYFFFFFFF